MPAPRHGIRTQITTLGKKTENFVNISGEKGDHLDPVVFKNSRLSFAEGTADDHLHLQFAQQAKEWPEQCGRKSPQAPLENLLALQPGNEHSLRRIKNWRNSLPPNGHRDIHTGTLLAQLFA